MYMYIIVQLNSVTSIYFTFKLSIIKVCNGGGMLIFLPSLNIKVQCLQFLSGLAFIRSVGLN